MPARYNIRILQCTSLSLGQCASSILLSRYGVVLVQSLLSVNVGGVNESLHSGQHILGNDISLSLVNSVSQLVNGSLHSSLARACIETCSSIDGLLQSSLHSVVVDLIKQFLSLILQIVEILQQGSGLNLLDGSIGSVVVEHEVIPNTPQVGVALQLSTKGDGAVLNLHIDGLTGIETILKRDRGIGHAVLSTGLQRECRGSVVDEEHGQVLVVLTILTIESLSSQLIDTVGNVLQSLAHGELRVVGLHAEVGVVTSVVLVGGLEGPVAIVTVVTAEVRIGDQEGHVDGILGSSVLQVSHHFLLRNNEPKGIQEALLSGDVDVLAQHGRRAIVAIVLAVGVGDGVTPNRHVIHPIANRLLFVSGDGQRHGSAIVHIVTIEVDLLATIVHLCLEVEGAVGLLQQLKVFRILDQRSTCTPVIAFTPALASSNIHENVLAIGNFLHRRNITGILTLNDGDLSIAFCTTCASHGDSGFTALDTLWQWLTIEPNHIQTTNIGVICILIISRINLKLSPLGNTLKIVIIAPLSFLTVNIEDRIVGEQISRRIVLFAILCTRLTTCNRSNLLTIAVDHQAVHLAFHENDGTITIRLCGIRIVVRKRTSGILCSIKIVEHNTGGASTLGIELILVLMQECTKELNVGILIIKAQDIDSKHIINNDRNSSLSTELIFLIVCEDSIELIKIITKSSTFFKFIGSNLHSCNLITQSEIALVINIHLAEDAL